MKNRSWAVIFILAFLISPVTAFAADTAADYIANGNALVQKKDYEDAIKQYQKALEEEPKNAKANLLIGLCYTQLGDLEKGLRYIEPVTQSTPSYTAFYNLGLVYAALGKSEKALQAFDQAATFNAESFAVEYQKGLVYSLMKKYAEAIPCYQRALTLNPALDRARIALVGAFLKEGDKASALEEIEKIREMNKPALAESLEARVNS